MKNHRSRSRTKQKFNEKLVLNQWLMSLFGLRHQWEVHKDESSELPFRALSDSIKDSGLEGIDSSNLHRFFHVLRESKLFQSTGCALTQDQLLEFEENIVRHTRQINLTREKPIVWKYFQWLTLLFVEIYLNYFFEKPNEMVSEINVFLDQFNRGNNTDIPPYEISDINKLSLQNATGSGKTLLMHVNFLQFRHYASQNRKESSFTRTILLTPNEDLTKQHLHEFRSSGISADLYLPNRGGTFDVKDGLNHVDVLEITKLGEEQKEKTVATRSFGDQNLLFVDEGHRGMSGKEQGAWFSRRADLCSKGFTFEYSATFEQAVKASTRRSNEVGYAKSVIFDYSYRWFHEDGFGKDYLILNLPEALEESRNVYLTGCLLRLYQHMRLYQENFNEIQ
ncbi:MAG: DEAD/DEAH box helicase, partial [Gammaproteobacteria bacterium]|nr:DEAD/DEAH box helicase [Gammaproteobacteria bacterium]